MQDVYMESAVLVDLEDNIVRPTRAILTSGGWFFGHIGTYTVGSPLVINDGVKTKISFDPVDMDYTDGRNLSISYDSVNDRFSELEAGDCFIINLRFKMKSSTSSGHVDVLLESPTVSFNPITAHTLTFNKAVGDEQFHGVTEMIFISTDVAANGLELYMKPHGTNIQVYDLSILVSKQYSDN